MGKVIIAWPRWADPRRNWLYTDYGDRLHFLSAQDPFMVAVEHLFLTGYGLPARATCGQVARWHPPGFGSRLGMRRCEHCCRKLGIPGGIGAGCNDERINDMAKELTGAGA